MLLIDRLIEAGTIACQQESPLRDGFTTHLGLVQKAIVFEVTECVSELFSVAFKGGQESFIHGLEGVPCPPPAPLSWVEWEYVDPNGHRVRYGVLIDTTDTTMQQHAEQLGLPDYDGRRPLARSHCFYTTSMAPGIVIYDISALTLNLGRDQFTDIVTPSSYVDLSDPGFSRQFELMSQHDHSDGSIFFFRARNPLSSWFGLPVTYELHPPGSPPGFVESTIPAWTAFALLTCKNIEQVEHHPNPKLVRRIAKQKRPPRVIYKTLRIVVPDHLKPYADTDNEKLARKTRLHFVRGHFKNLTHPRYKEKRGRYWWPSHWRGNSSLGRIEKRYEVANNPLDHG